MEVLWFSSVTQNKLQFQTSLRLACFLANHFRFVTTSSDFGWDLKERDHLKDVSVDGRIVFKRIFKKCDGEAWIGLIWVWIKRVRSACECGNKVKGSIKLDGYLNWLRTC
jgi:hypothetical protein